MPHRPLFLLLPLLLLLLPSFDASNHTSYRPGLTYVYRYEGHVVAGAPHYAVSFTGFRLTADVHLRLEKGRVFVASLSGAKYRRVSDWGTPGDPIGGGRPGSLPRVMETEVGERKTVARLLALPVRFTWSAGGLIRALESAAGDVYWSLNLKRGVLSMLSAPFAKINDSEARGTFEARNEASVEGQCSAVYTFLRSRARQNRSNFTLHRQRDLSACNAIDSFAFSNLPAPADLGGRARAPWDPRREVRATSDSVYTLSKAGAEIFLFRAEVASRYDLAEGDTRLQPPATVTRQELVFVGARAAAATPSTTWKRQGIGLRMYLPRTATSRRRAWNRQLQRKAQLLLRDLGFEPRYNGVVEGRRLIELVALMRRLSAGDLHGLWKVARQRKGNRQYFVDALAAVGTRQAGAAVVALVSSGELSDRQACRLLHQAAVSSLNARPLLDGVKALTLGPERVRPRVLQALWLSAGSAFASLDAGRSRAALGREAAAYFRNQSLGSHPGLSPAVRTLTLVAAMGNAGLPALADAVAAEAGAGRALRLRLQAQRAWRKLAARLPGRTRRLFLPAFTDPREDAELRIGAYLLLVRARPGRRQMLALAAALRRERSREVLAFVVSHLRRWASLAGGAEARWALQALPLALLAVPAGRSRVFVVSVARGPRPGLVGSLVFGPEMALPRAVSLAAWAEVGGRQVELWEARVRSPALPRLLARLMGAGGGSAGQAGPEADKDLVSWSLYGDDFSVAPLPAALVAALGAGRLPDALRALAGILGGAKGKWGEAAAFEESHVFDAGLLLPSSVGLALSFNRSLTYTASLWLGSRGLGPGLALQAQATATHLSRRALGICGGPGAVALVRDVYETLMPARRRFLTLAVAREGAGSVLSLLPIDPAPVFPLVVLESRVDTFFATGPSYFKPNRRPLEPAPPSARTEAASRYLGGLVRVRRTAWEDPGGLSRRPWTPGRTVVSVDPPAVGWAAKSGLRLSLNATRMAASPPARRQRPGKPVTRRLRKFFYRRSGPTVVPSPTSPDLGSWSLLDDAVSLHLRAATAHISLDRDGLKSVRPRPLGSLRANLTSSSALGVFRLASGGPPVRLEARVGRTGPRAVYAPEQPLTVTTNARFEAWLAVSVGNLTLVGARAELRKSAAWAARWRAMLDSSAMRERLPFAVRRCIHDMTPPDPYSGPRLPDSPTCLRAWRLVNAFDVLTLRLPAPLAPLAPLLRPYFSSVAVRRRGNSSVSVSARLAAADWPNLEARARIQDVLRLGPGVYSECELSAYRPIRVFGSWTPERVHVRAFSGRLFSVKTKSAPQVVVMATTTARAAPASAFKVALRTQRGEVRVVVVSFAVGNASCTITMVTDRLRHLRSRGRACGEGKNAVYRVMRDDNRSTGGWRLEVPAQGVVLLGSGTANRRQVVLRVGPARHGLLDGLCGGLGRGDVPGACWSMPCPPGARLSPDNAVLGGV